MIAIKGEGAFQEWETSDKGGNARKFRGRKLHRKGEIHEKKGEVRNLWLFYLLEEHLQENS